MKPPADALKRPHGTSGVIDPHAKLDTSTFLLRRMRRVAAALEGLRARLERPAHHLDALRWRLHGPVGPVQLARRLAENEREKEGAGFLIAEVALTVRRVNWASSERAIHAAATMMSP